MRMLSVDLELMIYSNSIKNKSVRAIGKIIAKITAVETENGIKFDTELGELTDERKATIERAMADGDSHGYDLRTVKH